MHILLADDQHIVRIGFMSLLNRLGEQVIFHEADTHSAVLSLAKSHQPHIALLDLSLGGVFTLDLIKNLRKHVPSMSILVISMQDEMHYAERVLKAGARGYAMKNWNATTILQAVEAVYQGKVWLSDRFRNRIIERMIDEPSGGASQGIASLSDRELMVFRLIGAGLKKSDIARRLNLSPNTVETYRSHIKQKLNIETGAELTRIAFLQWQEERGHPPKEPFFSGV
ncbi:response regulator [Herbaspirillum seropedicae]|uniref:response regulator n=1 Tax=Herbaspirillum seropedicae TaxID=964 RepID=UPI003F8D4C04